MSGRSSLFFPVLSAFTALAVPALNGMQRRKIARVVSSLLVGCGCGLALNPSLDISQYAHTSWNVRNGWSVGSIYAMAQTPDGYLWLGSEFGLFRFDGVRAVAWQSPDGQKMLSAPYSLLVTRDGTLWIGTFAGLLSWDGHRLTRYPDVGELFVTSLLEDREGTVWAGILFNAQGTPRGRLCQIRGGRAHCFGDDGAFGSFVWSLLEDGSGTLWAGAESGLWQWKPGLRKRYAMTGMRVGDLVKGDDGRPLVGVSGAGLLQVAGGKLESYLIRDATNRNRRLPDRDIDSNKLLRDRDGGLWIGTRGRGLLHIHNGRTDIVTKSEGLSGDVSCSLFEDREGNVWFASTEGLDRFRELPVTTFSVRQGLSSEVTHSVFAAPDGSVWIATADGLARWKDGVIRTYRRASGLPVDDIRSLFGDDRGRIWASTSAGLAYFANDRFVALPAVPKEVYPMTGDTAGDLWLSGKTGLHHVRDSRIVETFPWAALGRRQQAMVVLADEGGIWLAFWEDGGVLYFRNGRVQASYTPVDERGNSHVADLRLDRDGALWAATEKGGLSRIKDGRLATLTTRNGLPCHDIRWSIEDDDRSLWLYCECGLVRITRSELLAWIADPKHKLQTTVWDAADGLIPHVLGPGYYGPPVTRSTDGRLWFSFDDIRVVDPRHLAGNNVPPPVHIEQIKADGKPYPLKPGMRLPANVRDLSIDYTALSLAAPEKIHFKYMLEGQDPDWKEVVNNRQAQYSNLRPRSYRFRLMACNNSGVWNEAGDTLEFSIAPTYYQTPWFYTSCVFAFLAMLWGLYQLRVYQIRREFNAQLDGRVDERLRVARELHDTLLQSFQASLIYMQAAYNLMSRSPAKAIKALQDAITASEGGIADGRDAIQNMRSSTSVKNDLARALRLAGDELAGEGSAKLEVRVQGLSRDVHPILRDEVYRIALEAIRNAFQHSEAQAIEAEILYGESLRVRVRDDGKGIDPAIMKEGRPTHYGLSGMRERAERIGGTLEVWSGPGAGTEIQLTIPGTIAFGKSGGGSLFRRFRRKSKSNAAGQS